MREILFRGKRIDNGEWVEGVYFPENDTSPATIFNGKGNCVGDYVVHETVGQYTGLTDENGKKIFEGDVFRYGIEEVAAVGVIKFGEYSFGSQFDMNNVGFYVEWKPRAMYYRTDLGFWVKQREVEIIGNIHDNPELMEQEG